MQEISYKTWLQIAQKKCKESGVELTAPLILLEYISKKNRVFLQSHNDIMLSNKELTAIDALLERRLDNEPLAYILNNKEFYARDFYVDKNVLIPRPETELIIDECKQFFNNTKLEDINMCDIGTGSGCLAISLALEIQNTNITAIDISKNALDIAQKNAVNLQIEDKIHFTHQDIKEFSINNSKEIYNCIVSNPPYIPEHEYIHLEKNVLDYEPKTALTSGKSGLEIIEDILIFAQNTLISGGLLLIEHGYNQNIAVQELAKTILIENNWHSISTIKDYADNWRIFKAIKK